MAKYHHPDLFSTPPALAKETPPPPISTNLAVHFSSATDLWATPQDLFDSLNKEFGFTVDVCAIPSNAKCQRYFTPEQDGLQQEWTGICWMNPPYGREIGKWVRKARLSAKAGALVVCLVPARTDTKWWHDHVTRASEVRFVRGRLRFGNATASAPFPSAIVVFGSPPPCGAVRVWRCKL